jgi:hypothetical protein
MHPRQLSEWFEGEVLVELYLLPMGRSCALVWHRDGRLDDVREFADAASALDALTDGCELGQRVSFHATICE